MGENGHVMETYGKMVASFWGKMVRFLLKIDRSELVRPRPTQPILKTSMKGNMTWGIGHQSEPRTNHSLKSGNFVGTKDKHIHS